MSKDKQKIDSTLTRGMVNLQANQQGKISTQQKDRIRRDMREARQRYNQQIILSGVVFLVVAVVLALMPFVVIPVVFIPFIWAVGVALWYAYAWYEQQAIRTDLSAGIVTTATGYIDKSTRDGYHITIDGVDYATAPDIHEAFNDTARYTVYVTPNSKIVLSAEVIDEPADDYESDETDPQASPYTDGRF